MLEMIKGTIVFPWSSWYISIYADDPYTNNNRGSFVQIMSNICGNCQRGDKETHTKIAGNILFLISFVNLTLAACACELLLLDVARGNFVSSCWTEIFSHFTASCAALLVQSNANQRCWCDNRQSDLTDGRASSRPPFSQKSFCIN